MASPSQTDSIYAGDNAFNNGEFGYNNLQQIVGTWTHKFNDKIYTATETLYMYMNDATTHPTKDVPFSEWIVPGEARLRAGMGHPQFIRCSE